MPQGSVLGPTLFLLFINDLPDHILLSLIDIFADDTTVYDTTSKRMNHDTLATALTIDLNNVVEWGKKWLVTFNASKTKLITFHHYRANTPCPEITMNGVPLEEQDNLDRLLGLKFTTDLKWKDYIFSVAKDVSKMIGSLFRSRAYLTPEAILYLYKSQIRPKMEYCSHIWAGSPMNALSVLDRLQNRIKYLIGDQLFQTLPTLGHRRNVACLSLFYRYFHGKCSTELHDLVPPQWKFNRNTRLAISCANHPHFLRLPLAKTKFHSKSFFLRTAEMWNTLPAECFPQLYNLDLFKSNVNKLQLLD